MEIQEINLQSDIPFIEKIIKESFSQTPDSNINDWFSLEQMAVSIKNGHGKCLKAMEKGEIVGIIHAYAENLINGREGIEKWVISNLAISPIMTGQGIGSILLKKIEELAKSHGVIKIYVHTNQGDERVIHFYEKNGYQDAGSIKDYYYNGSAIFLLKHLD